MGILLLLVAIPAGVPGPDSPATAVRFATFNASMTREAPGGLIRDLAAQDDAQARNVAEIVQRVRPDVLLINEFDFDPEGRAIELFARNYLAVGQGGAEPIAYPFSYADAVNTGVASGRDLDHDGQAVTEPGSRGYGNDALGYGQFPGQYGMVVFSRFPIDRQRVRSFGRLLWKDVPGALLPSQDDGTPWYDEESLAVLPLSSKSHWDVPVAIEDRTVHLLVSHPTPPAFDGPEERNKRRNHDEIRLWADYLTGGEAAAYLGASLPATADFLVMGDLNADPSDGGGIPSAIGQLLDHPRVQGNLVPTSPGAIEAARAQAAANLDHRGEAAADTADFNDLEVGNLRVDYVLPSKGLRVVGANVFWPRSDDPQHRLVTMEPVVASSDHRMVFLDIELVATPDSP